MAIRYLPTLGTTTLDKVQITDLFAQISFKQHLSGVEELFNFINVIDQDSPESLAERFYGSSSYYWIILICNQVKDYFYDWPLKDNEIKTYSEKRVADLRAELPSDDAFIQAYQSYGQTGDSYETIYFNTHAAMYNDLVAINDAKRTMKYLKPRFLGEFTTAITSKTT